MMRGRTAMKRNGDETTRRENVKQAIAVRPPHLSLHVFTFHVSDRSTSPPAPTESKYPPLPAAKIHSAAAVPPSVLPSPSFPTVRSSGPAHAGTFCWKQSPHTPCTTPCARIS